MKHQNGRTAVLLKIALAAIFLLTVILPLAAMLGSMNAADIGKVLGGRSFGKAVRNTLLSGVLTTVIALAAGMALAFFNVRARIPLRGFFAVLLTLPMLIPSISQGSGLILLFGANGILTRMLHLPGNIYGIHGIVTGEAMYVTPIVFLMLSDVLRYEDYTPYEAAKVMDLSPRRQFTAITLPFLKKPLLSAAFMAFALTVTDYGVPLTVGGKIKTLPVLMYEDVIGLLDFGKGSVIGAVLLVPAVVSFVIDLFTKDQDKSSFNTASAVIEPNRGRDTAGTVLTAAAGIFMLLPVIAFAALTFMKNYPIDMTFTLDHIGKAFSMKAGDFFLNSILISLGTGLAGSVLGAVSAYCSARMKSPLSSVLHLFSITSMAIPGLVLGLSYVLFFKKSFLYGTMAILILVNTVHFFSSPYLMFRNSFGKLNPHLEEVGLTMDVSRIRIVRDVILPQSVGTFLEAFSYFFVNSMITISAVSFLAGSATKPVALLIPQYEAQSFRECSAFISLMILGANLLVRGIIYAVKGKAGRSR